MKESKLALLLKPVWTYRDIMTYFEVKSKTTAIRIKNRAIKAGGAVPYGTKYVKSDAVFALFGTEREREITLIKGELK